MRIFSLFLIFTYLASAVFVFAQEPELKSIEEVISGIDSLLEEIDASTETVEESMGDSNELQPIEQENLNSRSFRLENELLPVELRAPVSAQSVENLGSPVAPQSISLSNPAPTPSSVISPNTLPKDVDYSQLSLDELLREVDTLRQPAFSDIGSKVESLPMAVDAKSESEPSQNLLLPTKEFEPKQQESIQSVYIPTSSPPAVTQEPAIIVEDYIVLGDSIDQEMKEKIREAIMATRMASGGTGNPFVTRSVYKATSFCNKVLGRLTAPNHKRYRRDILLSLINLHEKNQAWVDAAKTYERFLEEFASDDNYPFEQHEDAPGIPDLHAQVGDVSKLLEGFSRGAPTIPETHIRAGKIYRELGADRMALNKFYDAINATLTRPYNEVFTNSEKRKGKSFDQRKDSESNQVMFEIAETFRGLKIMTMPLNSTTDSIVWSN